MNQHYIWIVTTALVIALFGLIILQAKYLKSASDIKEKQFAHTVINILNQTANHLELLEIRNYKDDSPQILSPPFKNKIIGQLYLQNVISYDLDFKSYSKRFKNDNNKNVVFVRSKRGIAAFSGQELTLFDTNSKENLTEAGRMKFQHYALKSILAQRPIERRVDFNLLFQIVADKLKENDIFVPFEYAVIQRGKLLYKSSEYIIENPIKNYQTSLFPNDYQNCEAILSVQFPQRINTGVIPILNLAIPSILVTLVLILGCTFTIYVIFKQKRLSKIKNDFINNMTHEFKTPISTISLASQMMTDNSLSNTPETIKRISEIISHECKRLGFQVEKVLQMAIFEEGNLQLKIKKIDIHKTIDELYENFKMKINAEKGIIKCMLSAKKHIINADEIHISNVISNVIDNAIKYSKNKKPEIYIRTENQDNKIVISIIDKGIGISKKDQEMIFEKFYRVHTGNVHNIKGFGLGLFYVKKIVNAHLGDVRLESVLNKGSKFDISLPLKFKLNRHGRKCKDSIG